MFFQKLKPEEVFTPRAAEVNKDMYVSRPTLERALENALRGNLHIVIHGESGTGKSWLYKQKFNDAGVSFIVANLANASRLGSIAAELKNLIDREGKAVKVSYEEEKSAGLDAVVATAEVSHTGQYEFGKMEPFEACLAHLRTKAGKNPAVLVFDNLEAAFTEPLLKELADLIILCDDERYAKYKTKILIVGVPAGVKEYYYKTPHHATVANRLYELPEVARLSQPECVSLVIRGFVEKLKYVIEDEASLSTHTAWITDRIPQMVHEYCLEAAFIGEENRSLLDAQLPLADQAWISKSMYHAYAVAEEHMNERDTKAGRRNQTLYALSLAEGEQFKAPEIEILIRREFPASTENTTLNVAQTLSQLASTASTERPIIRRSPKGDAYTFADPRYRMVLRSMLRKTSDERVEKMPISQDS
ncbi:ATP-binding protein [Acidovorax sp. LjRoot117]|uniref:ATP-binding protein n=1 Tax=Acidovorax sp. LjRoot117 TaxID=3342255 RepID=UPI003ECFFF13